MSAKKLIIAFALLGACQRSTANAHPTATFHGPTGDVAVSLEIAGDEPSRIRGLMYRKRLGASAGMLFVFPDEAARSFWMKNTYIPLDMIFISSSRKIVGVVPRAEPMTLDARGVDAKARYVLEVNGGFAAAHGIGVGGSVELSDLP